MSCAGRSKAIAALQMLAGGATPSVLCALHSPSINPVQLTNYSVTDY